MNYGKKGVRAKQKALNSKATKIERKLLLGLVKLALAAFIGIGICGTAAGLGAFKGILASTPNISFNDVVASGQATVVYDCAGNEIDQYVSSNSNRLRIESIDELPDYLGKAFVAIETSVSICTTALTSRPCSAPAISFSSQASSRLRAPAPSPSSS